MNEQTRGKAIRTALDPLRDHPAARLVIGDLNVRGYVTDDTIRTLLSHEHYASHGAQVLLDLVLVLLGYTADQVPDAHPARALHHLGGRFMRAYVGALAIVATGDADLQAVVLTPEVTR